MPAIVFVNTYTIFASSNNKTMATFTNTTGTKAVNIRRDATGNIHAFYVQIYKGEEQVLQVNSFATWAKAEKWANKKLNS